MSLCDSCKYQYYVEQLKPCIIHRDDCEFYEKEESKIANALEAINNAHWIDNHDGTISCSHCHTWFYKDGRYYYMRYCPYCGENMTEREDNGCS